MPLKRSFESDSDIEMTVRRGYRKQRDCPAEALREEMMLIREDGELLRCNGASE